MKTERSQYSALERSLGYRFSNPGWLELALTHRSHSHEHSEEGDYERLEFLGDSLLGFLVSERLLKDDEEAAEGILTRRKQLVVQTGTLAAAAAALGLGEAMRLGRGEETTGGRSKPTLLADVFEAVLGAVYLDGGIRPARAFVMRHLKGEIRRALTQDEVTGDYKTRLQEMVQSNERLTPSYRIVSSSGPDHQRNFRVEVRIGGMAVGEGEGGSRKQAEQMAARAALRRLEKEKTE